VNPEPAKGSGLKGRLKEKVGRKVPS